MRASVAFSVLAICLSVTPRVGAQVSVQKGFLKASVAKLDEPDRSTLLDFLAECRKVSDVVEKALIDNDTSKASKMASQDAAKQWQAVAEALRMTRQQKPSATLQYRNQAIEFVGVKEILTSRVWYALVSPTPAQTQSFVSVVVDGETGHAGRVIAIEIAEYSQDVPTWLQRVDAPVSPPQGAPREDGAEGSQ